MEDKKVKRNYTLNLELSDKEQKKYDKFLSHIKALYGEYGLFTWKLTPNGIGMGISVFSHLAKVEIDLTDIDSW
jgi:hypothetical protein